MTEMLRSAVIDDVAYGKREITLIAVPYEQPTVVDDGDGPIREQFMRGSFNGIESRAGRVTANRDHSRERVIGLVTQFDSKAENGLVSVIKVSDTDLGRESLQLAADGVLRASVAFSAMSKDAPIVRGMRSIYKARLNHIALTPEPAYEGAEVLDVRSGQPIGDTPTPNLDIAAAILRDLAAR